MGDSLTAPVHRLANNTSLRRVLTAVRNPLSLLGVALLLPWLKPEYFFIGLAVSVCGEAIQIWSFASLAKQKKLSAKGPYTLVRNPMYIGRYLLILGGVLMTGNAAFLAAFTVVYYFYVVNRVTREEVVLAGVFGEPYEQYCSTVNRFLPSFRGANIADLCYFRWSLFEENNAHWNLLGALLIWGGFYYFALVR